MKGKANYLSGPLPCVQLMASQLFVVRAIPSVFARPDYPSEGSARREREGRRVETYLNDETISEPRQKEVEVVRKLGDERDKRMTKIDGPQKGVAKRTAKLKEQKAQSADPPSQAIHSAESEIRARPRDERRTVS